ncbi:DEAD/DEAH box helicase [Tsuneonella mangrovi]|uniref:DEAD/DEAH box helicase n=1 Tax=Tsuneonella mangrovi TaxID=1982042 RepID=UPI000BA23C4C|nr:DEAD/DEAH box helicase [Tsuneonella mangrovi]
MTFEELGLSQPVLQALDEKNYATPTPIQAQAIPLVLQGRDLFGIAQTGTGKTAAFMLPSIDNLRDADRQTPFKSCRMLILAPTRELAGQIAKSARDYGGYTGLKVQSIVGGTSVGKDRNKLHRGTDILVATPGRLLDLVDQKAFRLDGVEILVLDEADQMLDLGFIHALKKIVSLVPVKRQTLLFSATMPQSIRDLAGQYLRSPEHVSVAPQATTAERVEQFVTRVNQDEKQALLDLMLRGRYHQCKDMDRVLVFTRTKHGADRVVKKLGQQGIEANAIHGNKSQPQRERALALFRSGKVPVLVATDIAARGIDIPGVSHVINFELPNVPEQYVHRIGRTARAGADGIALTLCSDDERAYLRDIQKLTGVTLDRLPLPDDFRAVIENAPIVKPKGNPGQAQQGRRAKMVQPRPLSEHSGARRGKPQGSGEQRKRAEGGNHGKPGGGNRRRRNRGGGGRQARG